MAIADKMIYLRTHSNLSTEDISEQSGVPVGTINKIFTGETKNPTGKTASKLARVFGVTAEYLLNDEIPIEGIKKEPTPVSESGPTNPISARIMESLEYLSPDQLETIAALTDTLRRGKERK